MNQPKQNKPIPPIISKLLVAIANLNASQIDALETIQEHEAKIQLLEERILKLQNKLQLQTNRN